VTQLSWTQDKYIQAYFYAAEALKGKKFPGTDLSYLVHVSLVSMEVMATLQAEAGLNGDLALQCALLHDVIEDGGIKQAQLKVDFNERVAQGVSALSKDKNLPKHEQMKDSLNRIQQQPSEIWVVKMADRITNLLPPPKNWTSNKIKKYLHESITIHESLKPASAFLADRLSDKIIKYREFI
jgi:(p)ppGpp synthase/HD superfamily hydrolase